MRAGWRRTSVYAMQATASPAWRCLTSRYIAREDSPEYVWQPNDGSQHKCLAMLIGRGGGDRGGHGDL
jgi:hypothetical protein